MREAVGQRASGRPCDDAAGKGTKAMTKTTIEKLAVKDYLAGEVDPAVTVLPEVLDARTVQHKGRRYVVLHLAGLSHVLAVYGVENGELKRLNSWPEIVEVEARMAEAVES